MSERFRLKDEARASMRNLLRSYGEAVPVLRRYAGAADPVAAADLREALDRLAQAMHCAEQVVLPEGVTGDVPWWA